MDRREFIAATFRGAVALVTFPMAARASEGSEGSCELPDNAGTAIQTFAFYQALQPAQTRSPSRKDGTSYKMPCLTQAEIDAGEHRVYQFWHGHGAENHRFTITSDDFARLRSGEAIEVYTDVVEGHRHALKIDPEVPC